MTSKFNIRNISSRFSGTRQPSWVFKSSNSTFSPLYTILDSELTKYLEIYIFFFCEVSGRYDNIFSILPNINFKISGELTIWRAGVIIWITTGKCYDESSKDKLAIWKINCERRWIEKVDRWCGSTYTSFFGAFVSAIIKNNKENTLYKF